MDYRNARRREMRKKDEGNVKKNDIYVGKSDLAIEVERRKE